MTQMTPGTARVIDPILTEVARGYRSNASPVANLLFPRVPVGQRGGRVISFGPDSFKLYVTSRAPGANTKRIEFGYASDAYALVDFSLEGSVPIELQQEAAAVPGIDLGSNAVKRVQDVQALEAEKAAADLALTAASYGASNKITLTGTDRWDDASGGNPFGVVAAAREAVRQQIGLRPNVLTLGPKVVSALRANPKVLDRLSTSSDRNPPTMAQLSALFEMEVVEAGAIYHNGTAFVDVWGTFAHLSYNISASLADMGSPSFGYTYQLMGHPFVEEAYFDRNTKTWYYPVTDARKPVLASAAAGYLVTTAVS